MSSNRSTSYAGVPHASPSVSQENVREREMTATSGLKCFKSLKHSGPVGSLSKMLLGSSIWHSKISALTWKQKTTKSKRLLFQLVPSTRPTGETGSGLLATPNTMDSLPPKSEQAVQHEIEMRPGRKKFANLRDQVAHGVYLPTTKSDGNYNRKGLSKNSGDGLATAINRLLPTPRAQEPGWTNDGYGDCLNKRINQTLLPTPTTQETEHPELELTPTGRRLTKDGKDSHSINLADTVRLLPTPRANLVNPPFPENLAKRQKGNLEEVLSETLLPTPTAQDYKRRGPHSRQQGLSNTETWLREDSIGNQQTQKDGTPRGYRLQPIFVEWMMGYPLGWTDPEEKTTELND